MLRISVLDDTRSGFIFWLVLLQLAWKVVVAILRRGRLEPGSTHYTSWAVFRHIWRVALSIRVLLAEVSAEFAVFASFSQYGPELQTANGAQEYFVAAQGYRWVWRAWKRFQKCLDSKVTTFKKLLMWHINTKRFKIAKFDRKMNESVFSHHVRGIFQNIFCFKNRCYGNLGSIQCRE